MRRWMRISALESETKEKDTEIARLKVRHSTTCEHSQLPALCRQRGAHACIIAALQAAAEQQQARIEELAAIGSAEPEAPETPAQDR